MKPEDSERLTTSLPPVGAESPPSENSTPKEEPVPDVEDQWTRRLIVDEAALRKKKIDQLVFEIWVIFLALGVCLAIPPFLEGEAGKAIERLIECCIFGSLVSGIAMIAYGWVLRPTDDTTVAEELERRREDSTSRTDHDEPNAKPTPTTTPREGITGEPAPDAPRTSISE
jgi:hypothetical protein